MVAAMLCHLHCHQTGVHHSFDITGIRPLDKMTTGEKEYTPTDWREFRRIRVWEMHQMGYKQTEIALALGLSQGGVSQIIARAKNDGLQGLKRRKPPGAKPRLNYKQKQELLEKLKQPPESFNLKGPAWTTKTIARMIEQEFGVTYHPDYIGALLRSLGWRRSDARTKLRKSSN